MLGLTTRQRLGAPRRLEMHARLVALVHVVGASVGRDLPVGQPDDPVAESADVLLVVRGEEHGRAALLHLLEAMEALLLEAEIANGHDLVEQKHFGGGARRCGEREPQLHSFAVGAERPVEERLQLGERRDLVEPCHDLAAPEAREDSDQGGVLAPGEVRVERVSEGEDRLDRPRGDDASARRLPEPADETKERRLA